MILAIDPGTEQSAFVLFDRKEKRIIDKNIVPNDEMVSLCSALNRGQEDVAIEMIASYGMPVGKEVFETCVWIGRFKQAAIECGINPELVYRKDVKMHLCGNTRAKDANIRQALIDLLGKDKTKGVSKDMWAALGVAVTVAGVQ
jgi:hypothetical protein